MSHTAQYYSFGAPGFSRCPQKDGKHTPHEPQTQRNNFYYSECKIANYNSSQWHCIPWFGNILDGRLDILLRWPRHRCRPVCVAGDPWHPSGCWSRWRGTGRPASLWPDSRKGSSTQPGHCGTAPRWDAPDLYQSWKNNIKGVVYIEGRGGYQGAHAFQFLDLWKQGWV